MEKVTIICSTYNHEKYIESCLEGFIRQKTNFGFKVIVHDDASTDETPRIITEYERKYPEIIEAIYEKENQFSQHIDFYPIIMENIESKYVAFCEGDDFWNCEYKLQKQVDFLESHEDYVACVHNTFFRHCTKKVKDFPMFIWEKDTDLSLKEILAWNCYGYQTSSLMFRRNILTNKGPWFGYSEYPLALFLALSGKIRFLSEVMSTYRYKSSSHSTRMVILSKENAYNDLINMSELMSQILKRVNNDEIKKKILEKKESYLLAAQNIKKMSNDRYKKLLEKEEKRASIKFFIRSNFRLLYKIIKLKDK